VACGPLYDFILFFCGMVVICGVFLWYDCNLWLFLGILI